MPLLRLSDTWKGQPNSGWVETWVIPEGSPLALVREAKRLGRWTGMACKIEHHANKIIIKPVGLCQVGIITRKVNHE